VFSVLETEVTHVVRIKIYKLWTL